MKPTDTAQRRFLFLLALLVAILAVGLLVVAKALIEHAVFRNTLGAVFLVVFGPLIWFLFEAFVSALLSTGRGQIEIHLPKWIHRLVVATLVLGSLLLLADEYFELGWIW